MVVFSGSKKDVACLLAKAKRLWCCRLEAERTRHAYR